MKINHISELDGGSFEIYLLIKEVQAKTARNGSSFITFILTDGIENMQANMWDTQIQSLSVRERELALFTLEGKPYNGKMSYTVERVRPVNDADGVSIKDFIPTSAVPPETLYDFCYSKADKMADRDLAALVCEIFRDSREQLLWQGAAKSVHHSKVGELLWHTARMAKLAYAVADTYSVLDRDMVLSGVLLHDIGKLDELRTDDMGITDYTRDGYLFGHALLGIERIKKYGERLGTPEEKIRCLCHIIASHHGVLEYGAITLPATAEAYAVHCIDLIDSRMYVFEETLGSILPGEFSDKMFALDNVRVYKSE